MEVNIMGVRDDNMVEDSIATILTWLTITLLSLAVILCISLPLAIWQAFVLAKVWGWFAVPIFHIQPINLATAFSIALLLSIARPVSVPKKDASLKKSILSRIFQPAAILLVAYATHWCVLHHYLTLVYVFGGGAS
jgi:hypothetical protein